MAYINPPDAGRRNLRDFIGWLQEVLEVAEREQGQQPDKPQGDED